MCISLIGNPAVCVLLDVLLGISSHSKTDPLFGLTQIYLSICHVVSPRAPFLQSRMCANRGAQTQTPLLAPPPPKRSHTPKRRRSLTERRPPIKRACHAPANGSSLTLTATTSFRMSAAMKNNILVRSNKVTALHAT